MRALFLAFLVLLPAAPVPPAPEHAPADGGLLAPFRVALDREARSSGVAQAAFAAATNEKEAGADLLQTGDLDGDGFGDALIVVTNSGFVFRTGAPLDARLEARSGATGALLWARGFGAMPEYGGQINAAAPIGDINGDGTGDVVMAALTYYLTVEPVVEPYEVQFGNFTYLDGRDGSILWRHEVEEDWSGATSFTIDFATAPFGDVDGDGAQEVVVATWMGVSGVEGAATVTSSIRDGPTGAVVREVLTAFVPICCPMVAPIADLNGDGVNDLVTRDASVLDQGIVVARDGATGERLWMVPELDPRLWGWLTWLDGAKDLNGDGAADIVMEYSGNDVGFSLVAVDGRTGAQLWQHRAEERTPLTIPIEDATADGRPDVLVLEYEKYGYGLALRLVDGATGALAARKPLNTWAGGDEDLFIIGSIGFVGGNRPGDAAPDVVVLSRDGPLTRRLVTSDGFAEAWRRSFGAHYATRAYSGGADVSGDARGDLVLVTYDPVEHLGAPARQVTLRLLDQTTGETLGTRTLAPDTDGADVPWLYPALRDYTGDGAADLLIMQRTLDPPLAATTRQILLTGAAFETAYETPIARYDFAGS